MVVPFDLPALSTFSLKMKTRHLWIVWVQILDKMLMYLRDLFIVRLAKSPQGSPLENHSRLRSVATIVFHMYLDCVITNLSKSDAIMKICSLSITKKSVCDIFKYCWFSRLVILLSGLMPVSLWFNLKQVQSQRSQFLCTLRLHDAIYFWSLPHGNFHRASFQSSPAYLRLLLEVC